MVLARFCNIRWWALLLATAWIPAQLCAQYDEGKDFPPTANVSSLTGPLRIVKLLWSSNATNAANTLSKTIDTALDRGLLEQLPAALEPLATQLETVVGHGQDDPRLFPAICALALSAEKPSIASLQQALARNPPSRGKVDSDARRLVFKTWLAVDPATAGAYFESLLSDSIQNSSDWQTTAIQLAIDADPQAAGNVLLAVWTQLPPTVRSSSIEPLTRQAVTMQMLLDAVAAETVSKDLVNTNQLRKWLNAGDDSITRRIHSIWGVIRDEDNAQRQLLVKQTLELIKSGATGSIARGSLLFDRVCAQCHVLHNRGFEVGPNIAGNGRGSLEQLVSNVLDPSLVIGEAFQARTVLTVDGQVVSGLLAGETDRFLKIKIQGGKIVEFDKLDDIDQLQTGEKSLMPDGVETQMNTQELLDLLAYLCLLHAPRTDNNELIPGTPDGFVQP